MHLNRRQFVATGSFALFAATLRAEAKNCPFRLAVIADEIGSDFEHSCHIAANDFGLSWIEVRDVNGKNITKLNEQETADAKKILAKYNLKVTDAGTPLFKSNFPGAPLSKDGGTKDPNKIPKDLSDQFELLEAAIAAARNFGTDRIRCFDFWRLEDPAPFRKDMDAALNKAATIAGKQKMILILENEMACNTGSGKEAAATLSRVTNPSLMLNWDPGNSGSFEGDVPYPDDYNALPKKRIGHCHVKSVSRNADNAKHPFQWEPVGKGLVDWVGQLKAFKRDGYRYGVSLETHWHSGPGTTQAEIKESSTRISMAGLKQCLKDAGINC